MVKNIMSKTIRHIWYRGFGWPPSLLKIPLFIKLIKVVLLSNLCKIWWSFLSKCIHSSFIWWNLHTPITILIRMNRSKFSNQKSSMCGFLTSWKITLIYFNTRTVHDFIDIHWIPIIIIHCCVDLTFWKKILQHPSPLSWSLIRVFYKWQGWLEHGSKTTSLLCGLTSPVDKKIFFKYYRCNRL